MTLIKAEKLRLYLSLFLQVWLNISLVLASVLRWQDPSVLIFHYYISLIIFINLTWIVIGFFSKPIALGNLQSALLSISKRLILLGLIVATYIVTLKGFYFSRLFNLFFFLNFSLISLIATNIFSKIYNRILKEGFKNSLYLGSKKGFEVFSSQLKNNSLHYLNLYDINSVDDFKSRPPSRIIYELNDKEYLLKDVIKYAESNVIQVSIFPNLAIAPSIKIEDTSSIPLFKIRTEPLSIPQNQLLKRAIDVIASFLLLILIYWWIYLIIAILNQIFSEGKVLFIQRRTGIDNKPFKIYKFRTLKLNNNQEKQVTKNDERVTGIGKFLRKYSIDELPQLMNVLKGEMSLVGPRPHMIEHTEQYNQLIEKFMVRHYVKPGITGLAQIKGYRGEIKNLSIMENRVRLDIQYIENWSFGLDIEIIFTTIIQVLKGKSY